MVPTGPTLPPLGEESYMCDVPSWIVTPDGTVLYVTDKDAKEHGLDLKDATGHAAIRKVYPKATGAEGEGMGKDTPSEVVQALLAGKMHAIAAVGKMVVRDGDWNLPVKRTGGVVVEKGATFTAPALEKSEYVMVRRGAAFTAPALAKSGGVMVYEGTTLTVPVLSEVAGYVVVEKGATFTAPALEKSGDVVVCKGATFTAPSLEKSGDVEVRKGATFNAPVLAESGSVEVREGGKLIAPKLTNYR